MATLVEACLALDVVRLVREAGAGTRPPAGTWSWFRNGAEHAGSVRYALDLDAELLTLDYVADGEPMAARVALTSTVPHYGGRRWWASCPGCGRRCGVLYLPPGEALFECRLCHGLTYWSARQHNARVDELRRRLQSRFEAGVVYAEMDALLDAGNMGAATRYWIAMEAAKRGLFTPRRRRSPAECNPAQPGAPGLR